MAEGDYVPVIVRYWNVEHEEFWAVLDDKEREEFFSCPDFEGVIKGERITLLTGTTRRSKSDLEKRGI